MIFNKILSEKIQSQIVCPSCSSFNLRVFKRYESSSWYMCKDCLLCFRSPVDDLKSVMETNDGYEWGVCSKKHDFQKDVDLIKGKWDGCLALTTKRNIHRVLDVGSGCGPLLEHLKSLNIDAYGLEPSFLNQNFSKQLGHNVRQGFLMEGLYPDNYFDVVTMFHCSTYIPNLREVFNVIHKILKNDGVIFMNDRQMYGSIYNPSAHFVEFGPACYYSKTSLFNMLFLAGFEVDNYKNHLGNFFLVAKKSAHPRKLKGSYFFENLYIKLMPIPDSIIHCSRKIKKKLKG